MRSWKVQLERTRSWKVLSWKVWSWKVWLKLERAKRSWKEPSEVGKNRLKLEKTERTNFSETFQLQKNVSNFAPFFLTSLGSSQLKQNFGLSNLKLSNFSFFPTALSNYTYPETDWFPHFVFRRICPQKILRTFSIFSEANSTSPILKFNV